MRRNFASVALLDFSRDILLIDIVFIDWTFLVSENIQPFFSSFISV
jgi:hypothetical protein